MTPATPIPRGLICFSYPEPVMRSTYFRAAGLLLLILPITACEKGTSTSELSGKVTYKNAPLTMGAVVVRSESGTEETGSINPDGTYVIKKAPRGTLKVRIICTDEEASAEFFKAMAGRGKGDPIGPDGKVWTKGQRIPDASEWSKIPKKYMDFETSGLTVEVKDSKTQKDFPLD
jgi:hypothetical protein